MLKVVSFAERDLPVAAAAALAAKSGRVKSVPDLKIRIR